MIVVPFGAGTDSTALLIGWVETGWQDIAPIDLILFADTGDEKPRTYAHIERMQEWLRAHGLPPVTIVKKGGRPETLGESCLRLGVLPSVAYGWKTCSQKFKIEPQDKFMNHNPQAKAAWARGHLVTKLIGYEFNETRRWMRETIPDGKYTLGFPLVWWEWTRQDCYAAIERAGLPQPGKSACFFCPSSTKTEIDLLRRDEPALFARAIAMEDAARASGKSTKVVGLGRRFSWRDYATTKEEPLPAPCMACVDG